MTPRDLQLALAQLGADPATWYNPPPETAQPIVLGYNVEDLQLYIPSRRTREALGLTTPVNAARFSLAEFYGMPQGGTWIESIVNRSVGAVRIIVAINSQITNDLVGGAVGTVFFDEVALASGALSLSAWDNLIPAPASLVQFGTSTSNPTVFGSVSARVVSGASFPACPVWVPGNYRLLVWNEVVNQAVSAEVVLSLPPIGLA